MVFFFGIDELKFPPASHSASIAFLFIFRPDLHSSESGFFIFRSAGCAECPKVFRLSSHVCSLPQSKTPPYSPHALWKNMTVPYSVLGEPHFCCPPQPSSACYVRIRAFTTLRLLFCKKRPLPRLDYHADKVHGAYSPIGRQFSAGRFVFFLWQRSIAHKSFWCCQKALSMFWRSSPSPFILSAKLNMEANA